MPYNFKIIIFGDAAVGKTTLVQRYVSGSFKQDTRLTIGVEFHVKQVKIGNDLVIMQIWDFGGEDRFRFMLPSYCLGAQGGIFIYDVTAAATILHLSNWMEIFRKYTTGIPIIVAGTKCDLVKERKVNIAEAAVRGNEFDVADVMEISSKTGQNVNLLFETIARLMINRKNPIKITSNSKFERLEKFAKISDETSQGN